MVSTINSPTIFRSSLSSGCIFLKRDAKPTVSLSNTLPSRGLPSLSAIPNMSKLLCPIDENPDVCMVIKEETSEPSSINISLLVEKCFISVDYCLIVDLTTNIANDSLLEANLQIIFNFIKDRPYDISMADEFYKRLFRMACTHVFHPRNSVSKPVLYSDYPVVYKVSNEPSLRICYNIIKYLISESTSFITVCFVKKLINVFESPVQIEQNLSIELVTLCFNLASDLREMMGTMVFRKMLEYKDGEIDHFFLPPALTYLGMFFSSISQPYSSMYFLLFRTIIFPLINSPFAQDFYQPWSKLSQVFYSKDSTTAVWCIRYLFRHWPVTVSIKQVLFLHQLQSIMAFLSSSYFPTISRALIYKLCQSLKSMNHKVAKAATSIAQDEAFLHQCNINNIPNEIAKSLDHARKHWSLEVRKSAEQAKIVLMNICKTKTMPEKTQKSDTKLIWLKIASTASMRHPNIIYSATKKDIESFSFDVCY